MYINIFTQHPCQKELVILCHSCMYSDFMVAGTLSLLTQSERIYLTFVDIKLVRHSTAHNRTGQILPQMGLFRA